MPAPAGVEQRMLPVREGRTVRALVAGRGRDLVLLEAGLGGGADTWALVVPHLAHAATVVAYDRAGYGGSDPAPEPRDLASLADDLEAVLGAIEHDRVVLVGHSWGGPIVRTLAGRGQARIAGLVLVDPTDERAEVYTWPIARASGAVQRALYPVLARLGLLAPMVRTTLRGLPEPHLSAAVAASATLTGAQTMRAEDAQVEPELERLRAGAPALGELPVRILSGQQASGRLERRIRDSLTGAHRASAAALPGGAYVEAAGSSHMVPISQPRLVAEQALALLR